MRSQPDVYTISLRLVAYTLQQNEEGRTKYKMSQETCHHQEIEEVEYIVVAQLWRERVTKLNKQKNKQQKQKLPLQPGHM